MNTYEEHFLANTALCHHTAAIWYKFCLQASIKACNAAISQKLLFVGTIRKSYTFFITEIGGSYIVIWAMTKWLQRYRRLGGGHKCELIRPKMCTTNTTLHGRRCYVLVFILKGKEWKYIVNRDCMDNTTLIQFCVGADNELVPCNRLLP